MLFEYLGGLAVHARKRVPLRDNRSFALSQFVQSAVDRGGVGKQLGKLHIGRMMPRFRLKQGIIEGRQLRILHMFAKQVEPFA